MTIITDDKITQKHSDLIVTAANVARDNLSIYRSSYNCQGIADDDFRYLFQTVRIWLPRQSGHTVAALQLMVQHPGSILLLPNSSEKHEAERAIHKYVLDQSVRERVLKNMVRLGGAGDYSWQKIIKVSHMAKEQDTVPFIIFDGTSRMSGEAIKKVKTHVTADIYLELQ